MTHIFRPTDILLPRDFARWSVIACDQFTSDLMYWERVAAFVGDAPSTLNLILPEVYLDGADNTARLANLTAASEKYLRTGVFDTLTDSFVLTRRTFTDGTSRLGLVGAIDLEAYDYTGAPSPVRASERTVPERLPPRIAARKCLRAETSHVMALLDDATLSVIEPLAAQSLPPLYDFELMEGGGHIAGWRVTGNAAQSVADAISAISGETKIVIGDGNHSLAAAKTIWEEIKPSLTGIERETHPARFALAEINNVYDAGVTFHAIHRVAFGADANALTRELSARLSGNSAYEISLLTADGETRLRVKDTPLGTIIGEVQDVLDASGARIDYIHGEDELRGLVNAENAFGVLLPAMEKSDLFATVRERGVFPRKSFSIGQAREKRYYLEARGL